MRLGHFLAASPLCHSLYAVEPKLGSCLELAEWPGGTPSLEDTLFAEADGVTATGTEETLASLRTRLPARVRLVGYGHRVSFGYVSRDVLSRSEARQIAARAASDVAAWDQHGCLSPHLFYVEEGGSVSPSQFAEFLTSAMARLETSEPRGTVSAADAVAITSRRNLYEVRAAASAIRNCGAVKARPLGPWFTRPIRFSSSPALTVRLCQSGEERG